MSMSLFEAVHAAVHDHVYLWPATTFTGMVRASSLAALACDHRIRASSARGTTVVPLICLHAQCSAAQPDGLTGLHGEYHPFAKACTLCRSQIDCMRAQLCYLSISITVLQGLQWRPQDHGVCCGYSSLNATQRFVITPPLNALLYPMRLPGNGALANCLPVGRTAMASIRSECCLSLTECVLPLDRACLAP